MLNPVINWTADKRHKNMVLARVNDILVGFVYLDKALPETVKDRWTFVLNLPESHTVQTFAKTEEGARHIVERLYDKWIIRFLKGGTA